jgi:ABC-type molybdenum transport system ATPase subunit/photorepair protein PhrA
MENKNLRVRCLVVPTQFKIPDQILNSAVLIEDAWDDWFTYETTYHLWYYDEDGDVTKVGRLKIGERGMTEDQRRPDLPCEFEQLDKKQFFSLGQDADYYASVNELGENVRANILEALNDIAADLDLWHQVKLLRVTAASLLREVSRSEVTGQFQRISQGGAKLTVFDFSYVGPKREGDRPGRLKLEFFVEPESSPPTNVHVLIGRNGVGKTHTLNLMTKALVAKGSIAAQCGKFVVSGEGSEKPNELFANLVSVGFSAFDSFLLKADELDEDRSVAFSHIGLLRISAEDGSTLVPKSPDRLATEFVNSAIECSIGARAKRWRKALEVLETDSLFAMAQITSLIGGLQSKEDKAAAKKKFRKLSSGHQIILLTITKLVELVEERTLVLIDEPEGHLHPPLLSAFVSALTDLLQDRNGVAIIATHSPVVLQEVPRECVWKLQRSGLTVKVERPDCQTFGENIGVLTRDVFGFEVTDAGFHRRLKEGKRLIIPSMQIGRPRAKRRCD